MRLDRETRWRTEPFTVIALLLAACGPATPGPDALTPAASQTIHFVSPAPVLRLFDSATVSAVASSGLPVTYSTLTPAVCSVGAATGRVTDLAPGTCVIAGDQPGDASFAPADQVTLSLPVVGTISQTIWFDAAPTLPLLGTATVSAHATSGLAVTYSSLTPTVCSVEAATGLVTNLLAGVCTIAADQAGNTDYGSAPQVTQSLTVVAPQAQSISFEAAPQLKLYGTATVVATASSGLAVTYSSLTPAVCSVVATSGVVTDLTAGTCTIAATQAGDTHYLPAAEVTVSLVVSPPTDPATAPGAPTGVAAALGATPSTVVVSFTAPGSSGGSAITNYTVTSTPGGLTGKGTSSPITVTCPTSCAGEAFSAFATNRVGDGPASTPVDVLTVYDVIETFHEPETQPADSIFTGSFTFNSTKGTASALTGSLTESMTGPPMATVPLTHFLSQTSDGHGGLLLTVFYLDTTDTFLGGGFAPGSSDGVYFGFPTALNPAKGGVGNAYAMIDINPADPTAAPTQTQINLLAYADCTALGMMGAVCMTGTTVEGYGTIGTMSGYPVSQTVTRR